MSTTRIRHYSILLPLLLKGGGSKDACTWQEKAAVCRLVGEDELLRKWCTKIEFEPQRASITCAVPYGVEAHDFEQAGANLQYALNIERSRLDSAKVISLPTGTTSPGLCDPFSAVEKRAPQCREEQQS